MEWEKYKEFGENIPDGLAIVIGEKVEWLNSAFAKLFKFDREELIGSNISSLFPPEESSIITKRIEAFREGKDAFTHFETTGVLKTDRNISLDIKINKIYAGGKEGIQFIARDITSIKQAEELLIKDRNSIRRYFDYSGNIMVLLNIKGEVSFINSKGCKILGYSREEIIGKDWFDNFLPEQVRNEMRSVFTSLINNEPDLSEHAEASILAKGGGERIISWHNAVIKNDKGEITSIFSSGEDITEIRALLDKISTEELFLSDILSSIQDGVSILNTDLNIVRVNKTMEGWYKHAMPIVGKKCYEVYQGINYPCKDCPVRETLKSGKRSMYLVPKRGEKFKPVGWLELYSFPLFDSASKEIKGVIEYIRDISEQKKTEDRLKELYENYQSIFNSVDASIIVQEVKTGKIVDVNPKMCEMCGYSREEMRNLTLGDISSGSSIYTQEQALKWVKKACSSAQLFEWQIKHKDGRILWSEINLKKVSLGGRERLLAVIRDITLRKKIEQDMAALNKEIIRTNKKLKELSLRDIQTGLYNHHYLKEIIEAEFYRAQRFVQPLSVIMIDIDYFKSINDVYGYEFGDLILKQFSKLLQRLVRKYDIVIRLNGEEFVVVLSGTDQTTSFRLAQRLLDAINLYSFGDNKHVVRLKLSIGVASYPKNRALKGINLINSAEKMVNKAKDDGGNRVYFYGCGKKPNLEVKHKRGIKELETKLDKLSKKANQNLVESIFAFAKTIELKDHYTGEHVEMTSHYATEIARELNLPFDEVERVKQAAVLHDLGKIGISEKILLKKSKLSKKEFEEIKKHPQIAVDILRPIHVLYDIIPYIFYHHERWDGKGYPSGMKREEIPIGARIISVADVYQALISNRAYRKAFSQKEAVKTIKEGAGTQFDPKIVDIFLNILDREK